VNYCSHSSTAINDRIFTSSYQSYDTIRIATVDKQVTYSQNTTLISARMIVTLALDKQKQRTTFLNESQTKYSYRSQME
jgi:hypothetical protein